MIASCSLSALEASLSQKDEDLEIKKKVIAEVTDRQTEIVTPRAPVGAKNIVFM